MSEDILSKLTNQFNKLGALILCLMLPSMAWAQDANNTRVGGPWYFTGSVGARWAEDVDLSLPWVPASGSEDFDVGLQGNIGVGYRFSNQIRAEGELGLGQNDFDGGDVTTFAVVGNIYYDFPLKSKITPYVGFGAGFAQVNIEGDGVTVSGEDDDIAPMLQAMLGVTYPLGKAMDLKAGYRYARIFDTEFSTSLGPLEADDVSSHTLEVGFIWNF